MLVAVVFGSLVVVVYRDSDFEVVVASVFGRVSTAGSGFPCSLEALTIDAFTTLTAGFLRLTLTSSALTVIDVRGTLYCSGVFRQSIGQSATIRTLSRGHLFARR